MKNFTETLTHKESYRHKLDAKQYEKQHLLTKTKLEIGELKHLVEHGLLDAKKFEEIIKDKQVSKEEMQELLANIDREKLLNQLEEVEKADLPTEYIINKQDYLQAFSDPKKKEEVLQKLNQTLDFIYQQVQGGPTFHGIFFGTYTYLLHQKLLTTHDTIIDLKQLLL